MVSEVKITPGKGDKVEILRAYVAAFRPDYWFKNVFTLLGIFGAIIYFAMGLHLRFAPRLLLALLLSCFISSVGYVINEVLDASFDALHPIMKNRPIPTGKVCVEILLLLNTGLLLLTLTLSVLFFRPAFSILLMCYLVSAALYNMPPIRLKDRPFLDIINESSSSPLRFLLGWLCFEQALEFPPVLALLLVWILGIYIMTGKRLAELRYLAERAVQYRKSFGYYSEKILLAVFVSCGVLTVSLFVFLSYMYRPYALYSIPLVVLCFAWFTRLTFQKNSVVQRPETVAQKPLFACTCVVTLAIVLYLLFGPVSGG